MKPENITPMYSRTPIDYRSKKGFSIASLTISIISCIITWLGLIGSIAALVLSTLSLIFAIVAKKQNREIRRKSHLATIGLVISIIGIVLAIINLITYGFVFGFLANVINS